MRTEFITDWVAELRSGRFQQGQQQLRMPLVGGEVTYCCLGVACEIGIRYGVIERSNNSYVAVGDAEQHDADVNDWNSATLPYGFWQWVGFDGPDPRPDNAGRTLTSMNDEAEFTFDQIADVIEQAYLRVPAT